MNNKKAIDILQKQQAWINGERKNMLNDGWLIQTEYYFRQFFKEDSWPIIALTKIEFPPISHQNYEALYASVLEKINKLFTVSIEIIKDVGIATPYKNFLSRIPDGWLVIILTIATITSFSAGEWWETHTFSKPLTVVAPITETSVKQIKEAQKDTTKNQWGQDTVNKKGK